MTIKVLEKVEGCMPEIYKIGDWVDLKLAEDVHLRGPYAKTLHYKKNVEEIDRTRDVVFNSTIAKLGICVEVPNGYECVVIPRSSTFKKYGIIQSNSMGLIDGFYKGNEDEWRMPMIATRMATIPKGTRIAQFRVQLSQKATCWQKIKWLFSSKIKIKKVKSLESPNRKGFGEGTANIN